MCCIVLEFDRQLNGDLGPLGIQIRKKRFEYHNSQWLQEVKACAEDNDAQEKDDLRDASAEAPAVSVACCVCLTVKLSFLAGQYHLLFSFGLLKQFLQLYDEFRRSYILYQLVKGF